MALPHPMQIVGDLTQTQIFDKEQNVGLLHKLMKVGSITISSVVSPSDEPVCIFLLSLFEPKLSWS